MNLNYRNFVSFAITLQILILLFATAVIPATAVDDEDPSRLPLILQGTLKVDGKLAPENTLIIAKVDGVDVGSVAVGQDGIYGQLGNKLLIDCEPASYVKIVFYVNGVKSQLVDGDVLNSAYPGDDFESVNIVATSPVGDSTDDGNSDGSGSSGSSSSYSTATTSDSSTNDESSSESTASASTTSLKSVATAQSTDDSAEEVPAAETGLSMIVMAMIGVILFLGIIVTVGYKLKEN